MKITGLTVENWMRVREVDVALPHPITVFAGDNDQGKTSLQEAIRMAFLQEAVRVRLKKEWPMLVRQGAKSASVVVQWQSQPDKRVKPVEGRAAMALPSGKGDCHPEVPAALAFVLDAPRFGALSYDERRKFLFGLVGVRTDIGNVRERLLKRGCRADLIETITPVLRTGFEAANSFAVEKQRDYRASWKQITGEEYGSVKGEKWRAPLSAAEVNREEITNLQKSITTITEEVREVTKKIGAAESYLAHKARYDRDANSLKERANGVGKHKKAMDDAERSITKHRPVLEAAEGNLAEGRLQGQPCPECGALLALREGGKLIAATAPTKAALAELESAVETARSTMRILQESFTKAKSDYDAAVQAAETIAKLEQAMGTPATEESLKKLKQQSGELDHDLESLTSKLGDLQKQERDAEQAKRATEDAKKAHQLVIAWGDIADALAPSGVPGELLEEALGPINRRLKKSAALTEWPTPEIQGSMQVMVGGIPYPLCGESVRWRVDAMLAEAISYTAGLRMLVLDRIDVLAPERRGGLLDWCFDLVEKDDYETILLFGTLKAKPQIEGCNVFWLEDGKV